MMRNRDFLPFSWSQYNTWDGRAISLEGIFMLFTYEYLPVKLIILIKLAVFVGANYLLVRLTTKHKGKRAVVSTVLFIGIFFIGLKNSVAEVLFWACGGYIYSLLLLILFLKAVSSKSSSFIYLLCLSFLIGLSGPNNFLIAASLLSIKLFINYRQKRQLAADKIILLGVSLLGFCIVLFAPGNAGRGFEYTDLEWSGLFYQLVANYLKYTLRLLIDLKFLILLAGFISALISIRSSLFKSSLKREIIYLSLLFSVLLVPYALADKYVLRSLWPNALILFFIVTNGMQWIKFKLQKSFSPTLKNQLRMAVPMLLLFFQLSFIYYIADQHFRASRIYDQFKMRETYILSQRQKSLFCIHPLNYSNRSIIHTGKDISTVPYLHFVGEGMENYYGIDSLYVCPSIAH